MRKDSKKFIDGSFALDVENRIKEFGLSESCKVIVPETSVSDLDPVVLFVEYNSVLQTKMQYIPERVKVEISCRSLMEPSEDVEMRSMIEEVYPGEEFSLPIFTVPTVVPGRTFLEKVFLLHEEFNRPNGCTHIERITRHMYDIVKMMDKPFAMEAMQDVQLYEDIVTHRKSSRHGVDWTIRVIFHTQYRFYLLKASKMFCVTTISRCKSASSMPMHLLSMRLWND